MKKSLLLFSLLILLISQAIAQDTPSGKSSRSSPIKLQFPTDPGWNVLKEGQKLEFDVQASGGTGTDFRYSIKQGKVDGMIFDSTGYFSWTPSYDFVDRLSGGRVLQVIFEVRNEKDESASQVVDFKVEHVNRPPVVGELKPLYVRYNTQNTYTIESAAVQDEDEDPIVFVAIADGMPEGAKLSAQASLPGSLLLRSSIASVTTRSK
ncbi:hypothetical protein [Pontibacter sp. BAB1700]|uniref:hypothetical protein n=1 Tax=Pontibacter sp. BAB1700 TaxID=1144253 RepID=UPI0026A0317B